MKKKIEIEYSFDKNGAIKIGVVYDMREVVNNVLTALRATLNGLSHQALTVASENGVLEKDMEGYLRTMKMKDLNNGKNSI